VTSLNWMYNGQLRIPSLASLILRCHFSQRRYSGMASKPERYTLATPHTVRCVTIMILLLIPKTYMHSTIIMLSLGQLEESYLLSICFFYDVTLEGCGCGFRTFDGACWISGFFTYACSLLRIDIDLRS